MEMDPFIRLLEFNMIITKAMIKNKFSEIIHGYLHNGYNIEILDASWRNSNMIDLTKSNSEINSIYDADDPRSFIDYIRVHFSSKIVYEDDNYYGHKINYIIEISRYNVQTRDFEIFKTYTFMQLNKNKDLYTSADDYDRIMQIRQQRLQNKYNDNFVIDRCINLNDVPVSMRNKVMDRIHNIRGMKSAKFDVVKLIHFHRNDNRLMCEIHWHDGCEKHGIIRFS